MPGIPIFTADGLPFFTPDGKPSFCEEDCLCDIIDECPECCVLLSASETKFGADSILDFNVDGDLEVVFSRDVTTGIQTTITIVLPTKNRRFICEGQSITVKIDFDLEVDSPHPAPFVWFGAMWKLSSYDPAIGEGGKEFSAGLIEWGEPTDELEAIKTSYQVVLDYNQCVSMMDSCWGNRIWAGSRTVPDHTVSLWGYSCSRTCCDQDQVCEPCCVYMEPNDGGGGCDLPELTWWDETDQTYYVQRSIEGWTVRLSVPVPVSSYAEAKLLCVGDEITITMQIVPPAYDATAIDTWKTKPYFTWNCTTWSFVSATIGYILQLCDGCGARWEDTTVDKDLEYAVTLKLNCEISLLEVVAGIDNIELGLIQQVTLPGIGSTNVAATVVNAVFQACDGSDDCCPDPPACEPCCVFASGSGFDKPFQVHDDGTYGEIYICDGDDVITIRFAVDSLIVCDGGVDVSITVVGTPSGTICAYPDAFSEWSFTGTETTSGPLFKCVTMAASHSFTGTGDKDDCGIWLGGQVEFVIGDRSVTISWELCADGIECCTTYVPCCSQSCYLPVGDCDEGETFETGGPTQAVDCRVEAEGFVLVQTGLSRHVTTSRDVSKAGCPEKTKCVSLCTIFVDLEITEVPPGQEAFLGLIRTLELIAPGSGLCDDPGCNDDAWHIALGPSIGSSIVLGGSTDLTDCSGTGTYTSYEGWYHEITITGPIPIVDGYRCAFGFVEIQEGETWRKITCDEIDDMIEVVV